MKPIIAIAAEIYTSSRIKYRILRDPVISDLSVKFECANTTNKTKMSKIPIGKNHIESPYQFVMIIITHHPNDHSNSSQRVYKHKENILTPY